MALVDPRSPVSPNRAALCPGGSVHDRRIFSPGGLSWVGPVVRLRREGLDAALAMSRRGPLQIEAAISAMHCRAHSAAETDWKEIAALYGLLEELRPIPAVRVNRAFALAKAERPKPGLALLDDKSLIDASSYPYVHLVRGTLLAELGRIEEARASLYQARRVSRNSAEAAQIEDQIARLEGSAT